MTAPESVDNREFPFRPGQEMIFTLESLIDQSKLNSDKDAWISIGSVKEGHLPSRRIF